MENSEQTSPGATLRAHRIAKGLTLAEVSERTGLPVSTLSKVENGKMSLTYDKMMRIATGLAIDIGVMFATPTRTSAPDAVAPAGRRSVARVGEGRIIETPNAVQLYPAADLLNKQLVPIISDIKSRTRAEYGDLLRHPGEEYVLVLEGAIELHTEFYAPVRLEAGDSIYFDSAMAHGYVAAAPGRCRILSVCSTAEWGVGAGAGAGASEENGVDHVVASRMRVVRAG